MKPHSTEDTFQRLDKLHAQAKVWKESTSPGGVVNVPNPYNYVNPIVAAVTPKKSVLGTQVGGSHYTDCAIQPIEYIWANNLGFSEGNVVKYVTRWKAKGGVKDLKKAHHHIALLIERAEAEEAKNAG